MDLAGWWGLEVLVVNWTYTNRVSIGYVRGEKMFRTVLSLGATPMAFSLTKPACLRLCLLVRFMGSRENWTPPPVLRLTR